MHECIREIVTVLQNSPSSYYRENLSGRLEIQKKFCGQSRALDRLGFELTIHGFHTQRFTSRTTKDARERFVFDTDRPM